MFVSHAALGEDVFWAGLHSENMTGSGSA